MEIKGASQGLLDLYNARKVNTLVEESPNTVIEEGIEEAKKQQKERAHSKDSLDKQVDSMNELLDNNNTTIKFNLHEDLGRMYVQVVSRDTDEVVKEIPPEQFLDMVASMLKHAGLLIDKRI